VRASPASRPSLTRPGSRPNRWAPRGIHLQIVTIPPGGRAKAHRHEAHETAVHVLSGESGMWYGARLGQHLMVRGRGVPLHPRRHAAPALQPERGRGLRRGHRPHRPERAGERRADAGTRRHLSLVAEVRGSVLEGCADVRGPDQSCDRSPLSMNRGIWPKGASVIELFGDDPGSWDRHEIPSVRS
jgi:hypothetical protein